MYIVIAIIVGLMISGAGDALVGMLAGLTTWLMLRAREQGQEIAALKRAVDELQSQPIAPAIEVRGAAARGLAVGPNAAAVPAVVSERRDLVAVPAAPMLAAHELAEPPATFAAVIDARAPESGETAVASDAPLPGSGELAGASEPAYPRVRITEPSLPVSPEPAPMDPPAAPAVKIAPPRAVDPFVAIQRWLFGGNTIVKLGVGILFIGLAFLARYTADQVAVEVWLAAIAAVAVALLVLGWRLRARVPGYAQVLQGGGVAVLYLTLFVAFRVYEVLAVLPVFVMMVAVAALSAALAVLQNAKALAVLGALGGFAAPLLVSTGSGNHVALFSYYLVLDFGIAAVAWFRTWRALNLIGFFATFLIGTAWGVLKYRHDHFVSSEIFLAVYFVLFTAIMLMPARHLPGEQGDSNSRGVAWLNGTLLFGLPTITFALQCGLVQNTEYGMAISALVLAGFYVAMAAYMRSRPRWAASFEAALAIGTVFITLVIPLALDAQSTAGAWALEGAGLVWLGFRQQRVVSRIFGYVLLWVASAPLMFIFDVAPGTPGHHPIAALLLAASSLIAAFFVERYTAAAPTRSHEAAMEPLFIGWASVWLLVAAGVEIGRYVPDRYMLAAWLVALGSIALLYTALATALRWRNIAAPLLGHAPLLMIGVLVSAAQFASPADWGGWWAWPLALLTHLVVLWRAAPRWPVAGQKFVHVVGVLVLAALGSLQGRALTGRLGAPGSAWAWLGWLAVPAVLLMVLTRPAAATIWPVRAAPAAYRTTAGAVLACGLLYWTLMVNLGSDGAASPLPYVPFVSPLDLGVGVALLAAWLWARGDAGRAGLGGAVAAVPWVFAAVGFVWLNAMMVRGFHHHGGVPFDADVMFESQAMQTGFTLLWAVLALIIMWLAVRRGARAPWMAGAGLLGLVIAKLLLVDLAASDTVTRIISFIGVGVLMLVIGFVAPLPATEKHHAEK